VTLATAPLIVIETAIESATETAIATAVETATGATKR